MPNAMTIDGVDGYRGVPLETIGLPPGTPAYAAYHLGRHLRSIGAAEPKVFSCGIDLAMMPARTTVLPLNVDGVVYRVNMESGEVQK